MKKLSLIIGSFSLLLTAAVLTSAQSNYSDTIAEPAEQMSTLNIGAQAPEIAMRDPQGNIRKLSDLKGKIVLIDFWASWCRPCRIENPNVVRTYRQYKDAAFKNGDGFEVFSVSLDRDKSAWENGIAQDKLVWKNHVSDLQFWRNTAARTYNVNSIPATFLIDGDGIIIKRNLRGKALENTLASLKR
ncbi:MAG TPA: TlpA family protein disulfide reductase [Cryomorphaceae bacterium]|nr:TlpA family protein disulfide reductase [Cryomorphaceae bacterium]|tara:strand:+ start:195 stop:755 length:561 start_codon:yes stop_codon:yes gene_type:complete